MECSDFSHILRVRERRLREQAIMDETERINKNNADWRRLIAARKNAVTEVGLDGKEMRMVNERSDGASVMVAYRPKMQSIGVQMDLPYFVQQNQIMLI